jgi:hypothetical protein
VQPPKPDCFKGTTRENIDLWLFEIEQYFNAVSLEDKYRATYAASLLRDGALTWWRAKNIAAEDDAQLQQLYEWETFSNELKQQFKPINSEKIARDHLYHLKQTKSVLQLITVFNTICADILELQKKNKWTNFVEPANQSFNENSILRTPKHCLKCSP